MAMAIGVNSDEHGALQLEAAENHGDRQHPRKLQRVGNAALQMLVSFVHTLAARNAKVEWENLSVALFQAAETLNLQDALAL
jgi:hypothetical protein